MNKLFLLLSLIMGAVVLTSNYLVQFPIEYHGLEGILTYGAFSYPIAFLITDLANRAYGKYVARKPDGSFKRKGPPYPANDCCGETKKGNNGLMYKSERNKKGVCTWKKIKSPKKKPAKQSPKRKPVTPPQQKIELLEMLI